jgi:hypothetical protein
VIGTLDKYHLLILDDIAYVGRRPARATIEASS